MCCVTSIRGFIVFPLSSEPKTQEDEKCDISGLPGLPGWLGVQLPQPPSYLTPQLPSYLTAQLVRIDHRIDVDDALAVGLDGQRRDHPVAVPDTEAALAVDRRTLQHAILGPEL